MLYSGHFSFDEIGENDAERHGYFTCVVDAEEPAQALKKFQTRIRQIKQEEKDPIFENIIALYVEDIVEIAGFPADAIVTRFQSSEGPFPKSKSCSLPTSDTLKIKAYQWAPGPEDEEAGGLRDSEGYKEAAPFLRFA